MKKFFSHLFAIIFSILFPIFCISTSLDPNTGKYFGGYFGPHDFKYTFIRYVIISLLIILLTFLNRKNAKVFTIYLPIGMLIVAAAAYFDYFYKKAFIYNYAYALWLLVSISVACAALFIACLIFLKFDFTKFYRHFWAVYTLFYLLILYVSFIRPANSFGLTVNKILGHGTIKYFSYILRNPSDGYMVLICVGNILIFMPLAFILKNINFKIKNPPIVLIGFILPILAETYQYVFKCGNVDIDDLVLNWSGFLIGLILMNLVFKSKIKYKTKK